MDKVLIIGAVWPEPKSSAGGSRMIQLIDFFVKDKYKVFYCSAASNEVFNVDLVVLGVEKFNVKLNDSSFDSQLEELSPDVVVFDRFMVEEQFGWRVAQVCPSAVRIIETIDLHCLRITRKEGLQDGTLVADSIGLREKLLENDTAKREIAAILRSDLSLMISQAEIEILKDIFEIKENLLFYLPYKAAAKIEEVPSFQDRSSYMTIGNFKHAPNWDSVLQIKNEIFPRIRKKHKDAKMYVYGAYADEKVFNLNNPKMGFYVLGRADDAMEVMQKARVCLAPLRFGAGIKGKLVESMVCGTPNVTTSIGAEGMHGGMQWNGFVENDYDTFSDAAVCLHQDEDTWNVKQQFGFELLNNFDSKKEEALLSSRLVQVKNNLVQLRKNNFIGSMLMHHTMQSTKFMSRWIELKNAK